MKKSFGIKAKVLAFSALALFASSTFTSCTDEPETENRFTFKGELIADHLKNNPEYSNFCKILEQAKIGKKAGNMLTTLSTYGSYTCFAPTNEGIEKYLEDKYNEYKASVDSNKVDPTYLIKNTGITSPLLEDLSDSMATVIAKNHIIEKAYTTGEVGAGATFPIQTLNNRDVTFNILPVYDEDSVVIGDYSVVDNSKILKLDIKTENGYINCLDYALSPSDMSTSALLASQSEFSIFSAAMIKTGFDVYLTKFEIDPDYDNTQYGPIFKTEQKDTKTPYPKTKTQGFTLLVETNELLANPNNNPFGMSIQSLDDLVEFAEKWYKYDPSIKGDSLEKLRKTYTDPRNALYKFVAYHIIDRTLKYKSGRGSGGFIMEDYYIPNNTTEFNSEIHLPREFDRHDYFETALPFTSIKVTRPFTNNGELREEIVLNYAQEKGTYFVNPDMQYHMNVVVEDETRTKSRPNLENFVQSALNGNIFTINKILIYNEEEMAGNILHERMRWDVASLFPELTTNNVRWYPRNEKNEEMPLFCIPDSFSTRLKINNTTTHAFYLKPHFVGLNQYASHQGDEFLVTGKSDFEYRIPYVPSGTYEIRFGFSMSVQRAVTQLYFGAEDNLKICGIPLDMNTSNQAFMGWFEESDDEEENRKNDKAMRNRGFMKAPASLEVPVGDDVTKNFRHSTVAFRRILGIYTLENNTNYWIRCKDVTEGENAAGQNEFNQDYLEIVPVTIMNNPANPEDIY